MATKIINRRDWLKSGLSLMVAGSLPLNNLKAFESPQINQSTGQWMLYDFPASIKARLTSNENPYGPSDKAKMAVIHGFKDANLYSRSVATELRKKIANYEGVKLDQVFLTAGLSEILNIIGVSTGLVKGDLVSAFPTFDPMCTTAASLGGKWIQVPLNKNYQHDLVAMDKATTSSAKLVYICNPGNPCSTIVDPIELTAFCKKVSARTLVFVDEAYNDYIPNPSAHSMLPLLKQGHNVMIGKTMSKVYGFAGLRIAYVLAPESVVKKLEKTRPWEFTINAPSMHGAMATIDDESFKQFCVKKNEETRENTVKELKNMGYAPLPSYTNFLIFPIKKEGSLFVQQMQEKEVGLRSWFFDNQNWCRVSIGRPEEMDLFLSALKQIS